MANANISVWVTLEEYNKCVVRSYPYDGMLWATETHCIQTVVSNILVTSSDENGIVTVLL